MSKIFELHEKRAKAWDTAKAFLDNQRGADRLISAEAAASYGKMEADIMNLGKEIARLERQEAIDAELNHPTSAPITAKPAKQDTEEKTGRASNAYRVAFFGALRGKPVTNVLSEGVDADGGYLVPVEFERTLVKGLQEANVVRSIAKTFSSSAERKIAVSASTSTATWVPENGTIPESSVTFGQKTLDAFKLTDLHLTSPLELATYKEAIMEAMFKGTKRYIESEEPDTKNVSVE